MFRKIFCLILFLALASCALAQNYTAVTATVTDPNGIPYANGTIMFTLGPLPFSSPPTLPTTPPTPVPGTWGPFGLSAAGLFSGVVPSNASITPASTQWTPTVCPNPNVALPFGTQSGCFSGAATTISGSSQDISAVLALASVALTQKTNIGRIYNTLPAAGTSSITATTMVTAPTIPAGGTSYRLSGYVSQTILGTSCTGNSTIVLNAVFQDPNAASAQTQAVATFSVTTNGTLGIVPMTTNTDSGLVIRAKAGTAVQYSTTFTPGSACSPAPTVQVYPLLEVM